MSQKEIVKIVIPPQRTGEYRQLIVEIDYTLDGNIFAVTYHVMVNGRYEPPEKVLK